jgi:hypothetical protein
MTVGTALDTVASPTPRSIVASLVTVTDISDWPILIVPSRLSVVGSLIFSPLTRVPLVDPRSSTSTPLPRGRRATWRRDSSASAIVMSAPSRPMTISCSRSNVSPAPGPDVTTILAMRNPPVAVCPHWLKRHSSNVRATRHRIIVLMKN